MAYGCLIPENELPFLQLIQAQHCKPNLVVLLKQGGIFIRRNSKQGISDYIGSYHSQPPEKRLL